MTAISFFFHLQVVYLSFSNLKNFFCIQSAITKGIKFWMYSNTKQYFQVEVIKMPKENENIQKIFSWNVNSNKFPRNKQSMVMDLLHCHILFQKKGYNE